MSSESEISAFRSFNRFFTQMIGVLDEHLLDSPFSLTEARAIYEIGAGNVRTAKELEAILAIDKGYLSRIVNRFETDGLIERVASGTDRREREIHLTRSGRQSFDQLQERTNDQLRVLLAGLEQDARTDLVSQMYGVRQVLDRDWAVDLPLQIRAFRPGDLGWIVQRHGALYHAEYNWNTEFEALIAEIVAAFVRKFQPGREQCWIAELGGNRVGSVMCVRVDDATAKLRLLLVEPSARGKGVGKALVDECIRYAIERGYRDLVLWTNDILVEARTIYQKRGFVLETSEPHNSFGQDLVSQTWRLDLTRPAP